MVAPGGGLSRGALRFRAAHRSLWSRPSHPLRISAATQRLPSDSPATGQAAPEEGAASPYQCPPPAPVAASHRGYGALRSLPLSRWSFHRSLWPPCPAASPRPALYPPAYSRLSEAAAALPTGRHASRGSASRPYQCHRPGPPPDSRSASPNPPPDTREPQSHRQRGRTPLDGRPAAPTANPRGPLRGRPTSFRAERPDCAPCLCLPAARPSIRPASRNPNHKKSQAAAVCCEGYNSGYSGPWLN